jgi:hypothetical protein
MRATDIGIATPSIARSGIAAAAGQRRHGCRPPSGLPMGSRLFFTSVGKSQRPPPDPGAWFGPQRWGKAMRTKKKILVAAILAAASCGLLIASFSAASVPRAGVPVAGATVSPSAKMMQAARDLPVQQYDSY